MRNILAMGQRRLAQIQRAHASSMVTYRRGVDGATVSVPAVRGKSDALAVDVGQGAIDASIDDLLIPVADLAIAGVRFEPAEDDTIFDLNTGVTFRVMAVPGSKCWRYSDSFEIRYRVHVQRRPG